MLDDPSRQCPVHAISVDDGNDQNTRHRSFVYDDVRGMFVTTDIPSDRPSRSTHQRIVGKKLERVAQRCRVGSGLPFPELLATEQEDVAKIGGCPFGQRILSHSTYGWPWPVPGLRLRCWTPTSC